MKEGPYHIETSPLISSANQLTGSNIIGTSAMKELTKFCWSIIPQKLFIVIIIIISLEGSNLRIVQTSVQIY